MYGAIEYGDRDQGHKHQTDLKDIESPRNCQGCLPSPRKKNKPSDNGNEGGKGELRHADDEEKPLIGFEW
jgi:hypothetical protein